ncbi:YfhO family protein, partial [Candidatus Bathyarchaeota archaeon]|nr:YfhO family protein [Candidatus Bathyarchaeota archaeon]
GIIMALLWGFALFHPRFPDLTYTQQSFQTMKKAMLLATAFVGCSMLLVFVKLYKRIVLYGFIALVFAELLYGFIKFNPFVPKKFVFPDNSLLTYFQSIKGIDRIWGYGTAQVEANFATQYRLFSPDGTDPLNLKWYNEFIQASRDGNIAKTFNRTTRSDAQLAPGYGARDLPDNPYRLRVMDSLGVKYVIDRSENPKDSTTFPKDRFKEIWRQADWTVYENIKSVPRYFLTDTFITYETREEFEQKFFTSTFDPSKTILLLKKDASSLPTLEHGLAKVELVSYKPNTVMFKTMSDTTQLLYLSDTYDYGWNATIDGKKTPIYKANYAFRAVVVPTGTHTIIFSYQPNSFTWGIRIALVGIGLLTLYSLWQYKSAIT